MLLYLQRPGTSVVVSELGGSSDCDCDLGEVTVIVAVTVTVDSEHSCRWLSVSDQPRHSVVVEDGLYLAHKRERD
jgi:hypothetical protein